MTKPYDTAQLVNALRVCREWAQEWADVEGELDDDERVRAIGGLLTGEPWAVDFFAREAEFYEKEAKGFDVFGE